MKKNTFFSSCNKFVKGAGLAAFFAALLIFSNGAYAVKKASLAAKAGKSNTVNKSGNRAIGSDVNRHQAISGNPYLSNLTLSAGVFLPPSPGGDTSYVAVGSTVSSVTVTPTAISSTAAITINGTPVASGTASSPVSLNSGDNDIIVAVTDSSSSNVFTIIVTQYPPVTISYNSPQTLYRGISASVTPTTSNVGTFKLLQRATFAPPSTYGARAVCLDAAGNVYFVNGSNAYKIPAAGGPAINLASGFNNPAGITVDASGVVYIADYGNNAVKKVPAGGGPPATIGAGFSQPSDVAVDASGNVYVADLGNYAVKEILAGNGQTVTVASGLSYPSGLAMDKTGNLYIADQALKEIPAGSTTVKVLITLNSFPDVKHIAIDKYGDFYLAGDNGFYLIPQTSINLLTSVNRVPLLSAGLQTAVTGIAVDASLNIYIASSYSSYLLSSYLPSGVYLLTTPLPAGLAFNNNTGVISGVPTAISPATNYTVIAYGPAASSSATVNLKVVAPPAPAISYSSPQTFYVDDKVTGLTPASSYVGAVAYSNAPTVFASGLTANAINMAQDAQGNFYVSNSGSGTIQEVPAGGGPPVNIFTATSNKPVLAVDAAGDIFESDGKNVYKILKGSSTATLVASGFASITGMVVDPAGDIIVANGINVEKILASDGSISIVTSISAAYVAIDGAGNLYIFDPQVGAIREFPAGGGPSEIDINLTFSPGAFSVDAAGDIFFGSGKNAYEILTNGGPAISLGSAFIAPRGIVVAPSGTIYVADATTIKQTKPTGGYAITPALPAGLSLNNSTGVISGTPVAVSPATNYTITATNVTGTATATLNIAVTLPPAPTISYASPQTYFDNGPITPLTPTSTNVYPLHYSSTVTTVGSGFSAPTAVANDAAGNIYVADFGNNAVKKIPAGGGAPVVLGSGFSHPAGVAVDAADNVYVADYGNDVVKKIPAGGGTPITIGTGFSEPMGLAVDNAGNVFVADYGNNLVKKIPAGGGAPIILGSGFSHPYGLAVDLLGDLFIADAGNNTIEEIWAGTTTPFGIFTASAPHGVAISPAGIIYVVNTGANNIEITGNGVAVTPATIATGFNSPAGIMIDGAGNVYIADEGNNAIKEIKPDGGYFISRFLPWGSYYTGLFLNSYTGVISGTPLTLSPPQNYTVTGYNISGSAAATLNIRVIAYPYLSNLAVNVGTLSPAFNAYPTSYSYSDAAGSAAAIKVTPATNEAGLTITVNGAAVASGTASGPITLSPGANTITVVVTAHDGVTKQTYTVTVGQGSNDAYLASLSLNGGSVGLSPSFAFKTLNYTASVPNSTSTVTVKPSLLDATAMVTVNGTAVANKTASSPIALAVGWNTINIVGTAPDGVTRQTYTVSVNRASGGLDASQPISLSNPNINPLLTGEDVKVHQGLSPNGDGIDDIFTIDNITKYPQNKLMIMDRNGSLIYQAKGYDNVTKAFDGHSNINGRMQLPGTYFYALEYTVNGVTKRKTGFIVLKY